MGIVILGTLLFSVPVYGQYAARDALSLFPADTQQMAYTSLVELRALPQYPLIHQHLLSPQLRNLETFLKSAGMDPEKNVDELVLGWRGQVQDQTRFFGMAEGRFDPGKMQDYYVKSQLPVQTYGGYDLYAFGSGASQSGLFFTFFDYSTAAFGELADIKALVDVKNGQRVAIGSNDDFRAWEGNLEGIAPQWGIATGQAAGNLAIPWLTGGGKGQLDPNLVFAAVKAVLYRVTWNSGVVAHLSVMCQNLEAANGIGQLLTMLKNSQATVVQKNSLGPALAQVLQNLTIAVDGSQVNLDASTSVTDLAQLLTAPMTKTARPATR